MTSKMNNPEHIKMLVSTAKERMIARAKTWLNDPVIRTALKNRANNRKQG